MFSPPSPLPVSLLLSLGFRSPLKAPTQLDSELGAADGSRWLPGLWQVVGALGGDGAR